MLPYWFRITIYNTTLVGDQLNFSRAGSVALVGNNSTELACYFKHSKPAAGGNHYRLRIVDRDEKFACSPVVKLWMIKNKKAPGVFPNPATSDYIVVVPTLIARYSKTYCDSDLNRSLIVPWLVPYKQHHRGNALLQLVFVDFLKKQAKIIKNNILD